MKRYIITIALCLPLFATAQYFTAGGFQGKIFGNQTENHNIQLHEGWTAISSYLAPATADFSEVVAPVDMMMKMAIDRGMTFVPYAFDNTLISWNRDFGVWVKMEELGMLPVYGNYNPGATLDIVDPMLMPVLANFPVNPEALFDGKPLDFIKNMNGNGIYWPEYGINDLGMLHPGNAYKVFPGMGFEVQFPVAPEAFFPEKKIISRGDIVVTPQSHTIVFSYLALQKITPDDMIYAETPDAFKAGELVVGYNDNPLSMNIFGDDTTTPEVDGFADQEAISLYCLHMETMQLFEVVPMYNPGYHDGTYSTDAITVVDDLALVPVGIENYLHPAPIKLFPVPADDFLSIEGNNMQQIRLYNSSGKLILNLKSESPFVELDTKSFTSGIYTLQITYINGFYVDKIIIL